MTTLTTSPEPLSAFYLAIEWPFNEPLVERWKSQALTNEFCRSGLVLCSRWSRRSEEERFVITALLGLTHETPLDLQVLSSLDRTIVVTPLGGQYEHPTGYHLALNGSPPRGRAFIALAGPGLLDARYCTWFSDRWKAMPPPITERMLSYARSVSPKLLPL